MKRIGIVGGLGPQATARFYDTVTRLAVDSTGIRPSVVMASVSLDRACERRYVGGFFDEIRSKYSIAIREALDVLVAADVSGIAMPCFSLCPLLEEEIRSRSVHLIHPFESAQKVIAKQSIRTIGVLGTPYIKPLLDERIHSAVEFVAPAEHYQGLINKAIGDILAGSDAKGYSALLRETCDSFDPGVEAFMVACSEISLIPRHSHSVYVDLLEELIQETVAFIIEDVG